MTKLQVFFFSITLMCFSLHAQQFSPVKDEVATKNKISLASKNILSIKCEFVQEKQSSLLKGKAVSKGVFYFKKQDKIRLEYKQPFPYLIVMNNGRVLVKDNDKSRQMNLNRSKGLQQLNKIVADCISGAALNSSDFSSRITENSTQLNIEMLPQQKPLKQFFKLIEVTIEKSDYSATKIKMNETSGDVTILTFSNKQLNGVVEDSVFTLQ